MKKFHHGRTFATVALVLLLASCKEAAPPKSPAPEPYLYTNGSFSGTAVPESPDPLVAYRWDSIKATDDLQIYILEPKQAIADNPGSFRNLESLHGKSPRVTVQGTGSIRVDFGQVNAAWLEFDSDDLHGEVEMSISEFNQPAVVNDGAQNRFKTKKPVRYGNTYRLELNDQLYEGVRYGWIHVRSFDTIWHIKNVRLVCQIRPTNYEGSFSCSDTMLTRIWYTGAYGVKLNLLKDYFGAILMERSDRFSWTGDAYTSQAAALVAFGNYDFILTNIRHTADQNNGILSYSLYWVQSLIDYYMYTGDSATLIHYIPNATGKLDAAYLHFGKNPALGYYGSDERLGAMFENTNCSESQNAYQMLTIKSWIHYAEAMDKIGRKDLSAKYSTRANEKMASLRKDAAWYKSFGLHAAADAMNTGFTTLAEQQDMYASVFSDRVNRISLSPFNQYFIIHALSRMGKYDDALNLIDDHWGGMIRYGGTCFFELYRPSWNQVLGYNDPPPNNQTGYVSMCHPWGGGVIHWLSEQILGIRPVTPGFSSCEILPHPGRTLTWVKGSVPTPHGAISASFDVKTGRCKISIPQGVTAKVGIPKVEKTINSIEINGKPAWNGKYSKVKGIASAMEDKDFVYLQHVEAGEYDIAVSYSGTTASYQPLPWIYPVDRMSIDSVTGGDWGGKYGSSGYVLFAYDKGQDVRKMPDFVADVHCRLNDTVQWALNVNDPRAPASSEKNGFPRNVAAIHTRNAVPCFQTMTVDVIVKNEKSFRTSLYFLDWDDQNRNVQIEIFDLATLKLLSPVQVVKNFAGGKYLSFTYDNSVRIRINMINEPNASVSGIFFD